MAHFKLLVFLVLQRVINTYTLHLSLLLLLIDLLRILFATSHLFRVPWVPEVYTLPIQTAGRTFCQPSAGHLDGERVDLWHPGYVSGCHQSTCFKQSRTCSYILIYDFLIFSCVEMFICSFLSKFLSYHFVLFPRTPFPFLLILFSPYLSFPSVSLIFVSFFILISSLCLSSLSHFYKIP